MAVLNDMIQDLYVLLQHVSQVDDSDVLPTFVQGMNSLQDVCTVEVAQQVDDKQQCQKSLIPIRTIRYQFGTLVVKGAFESTPLSDQLHMMMKYAVQVLALILETRMQSNLLEETNARLEKAVLDRTRILQRNEETYQRIVETAQEGIWVLDGQGNTTFVNARMAKMLSYDVAEMIGRHLFDFMDDEGRELAEAYLRKREQGIKERHEFRFVDKQGRDVWALVATNPIFDDEGHYAGAMAMISDITERRSAEHKIVDYQKQLRDLVSQLSLTEEQLRKHLAAELHDGLGQTLALTKLRIDQLLAEKSVGDCQCHEELEQVQRMLLDMIATTQDMTTEYGSPMLYELGLRTSVEQWLETEIQKKHQIQVTVEDLGGPHVTDANTKGFIFRAIRELSTNVVKHAQAKRLTVSFSSDSGSLLVIVRDDGIGFQTMSEVAEKHDIQGGYGLFSVRERVDYMGGEVIIQSKPGQGSEIRLKIPVG